MMPRTGNHHCCHVKGGGECEKLYKRCTFVSAQSFAVPGAWNVTRSSASKAERAAIAQAVIDTLIPQYNSNSGLVDSLVFYQNAELISAISFHDIITGNKTYSDVVARNIETVMQRQPGFVSLSVSCHATDFGGRTFNNDPATWGVAAFHAYRAYGNNNFLDAATSVWNEVNAFVVSRDNAASGSHPMKNVTFKPFCNSHSVAGGVFDSSSDPNNMDISADTIGLSAYLFEETKNSTGILHHSLDLTACGSDMQQLSYQSGLYMQSLIVYANTTNDANLTSVVNTLAFDAASASWTTSQGVILEGSPDTKSGWSDFKGIFIRALHEVWSRGSKDTDAAKFIQSYVTVQYNALLNYARAGNQYSPNWLGPPTPNLVPWGQLAALDVLNAAIDMDISPSETTASSDTPSTNDDGNSDTTGDHSSSIKTIIGATVGGVAFLVILISIVALILRRRRRRWRSNQQPIDLDSRDNVPSSEFNMTISPFAESSTPSITQYTDTPPATLYRSDRGKVHASVTYAEAQPPNVSENTAREALPILVERLNEVIASFPPRSTAQQERLSSEGPPRYDTLI
ncbi:unnamed protein product [Somion occarium]|uniref:Glycoside hydrolase family 76 protein n=1 Tax=Somion occarium TaxID=3059160 RepID=A0ABP1DN88_9APHY